MNHHIYIPKDLLQEFSSEDLLLLGYKYGNVYIGVMLVPAKVQEKINLIQKHKWFEDIQVIGSTSDAGDFNIKNVGNMPIVLSQSEKYDGSYTVVMFRPPNYKNLEYFSINPILLQSMETETDPLSQKLVPPYKKSYCSEEFVSSISDEKILDKINILLKLRLQLRVICQDLRILKRQPSLTDNRVSLLINYIRTLFFTLFSYMVLSIQRVMLAIIRVINLKVHGVSMVGVSQVFSQLDLRLKQITYFPIQFLCYYDKSILYKDNSVLLKELGLPASNSSLNINNSNYINLYNSLWLMVNDVLLGQTAWGILKQHHEKIVYYIKDILFEKYLFTDLNDLITWISFHHPAGFKLNNELGTFIGSLFLWSLNSYQTLIKRAIDSNFANTIGVFIIYALCHLGLSFFLGFLIDFLNIITFHIIWFYQTSARIYLKQIAVIKSLFQLFRGKKYNVLRNRVDNVDNYAQPNEFFEVDQLLLGTLLFMILILLLPTVFSFYLTFFIIRLLNILLLNLLENLLIVVNFVPILVMLLKLKNSSRLQGGVNFDIISLSPKVTYLELSNKSLTYTEIFRNFAALFRQLKNFRTAIISIFFQGRLISLNRNTNLKFHYLMLPENIEKSVEIWKYFTNTLQ